MAVYVFATCPHRNCGWKSQTHFGGNSGRMMGVLGASNAAEDEYELHFRDEHYLPRKGATSREDARPDREDTDGL
jgi:hypothetical protein